MHNYMLRSPCHYEYKKIDKLLLLDIQLNIIKIPNHHNMQYSLIQI